MRRYKLESSLSDRSNFDEAQRQYAVAMMKTLSEAEALVQDPVGYAEIGWEAFEIDLEVVGR